MSEELLRMTWRTMLDGSMQDGFLQGTDVWPPTCVRGRIEGDELVIDRLISAEDQHGLKEVG